MIKNPTKLNIITIFTILSHFTLRLKMNKLNKLITSLSSEEQSDFEAFLKKKNRRTDTKNILLFQLLANGETNSDAICHSLYQKNNKNAYHALRKRLYDSVLDFIASNNLAQENDIEMNLIKNIVSARSFFYRKEYAIAFHILSKAERLAQDHLLFPILNEIYHTQIQYAHTYEAIKLDDLIVKFNLNQQYYLSEERLNIVYATIREQINISVFQKKIIDFNAIITTAFNKYQVDISQTITFKSLYQLISIASIAAFASKDYYSIESFTIKTYEKIKGHQRKQKQLYFHIQVLYLIANMYFRNKKFDEAFKYLSLMEYEMNSNNKKYFNSFILKYLNLLALCYNYSNQNQKAIATAQPYISKKHDDTEAQLNLILCLSMYYFHNKNYSEALKTINSLYHSDNWYQQKAGNEWVIKKLLIELLIHIELDHLNLVESRILGFKRKYSDYLKSIQQNRVLTFIALIEELYLKLNNKTTPDFLNKTDSSFNFIDNKQEDIFVMSFYAWLKAKTNNKDIYQTTLDMI